jgi:hypothetical protein
MKTILQARPNCAAHSRSAHMHTRPTRRSPRRRGPRGGARARWRSYKRDPELNLICASVENTIHIVGLNAKRSSPFPFLSMGKFPTSPTPAGAAPGSTCRSRRPPRVPTCPASRPTCISSPNVMRTSLLHIHTMIHY